MRRTIYICVIIILIGNIVSKMCLVSFYVTVSAVIIWALTREKLSSGACKQHRGRPESISAFVIRFLESANLLQMKFQFSS